ncbi:glycoside hydrolase, partial [Micrococcus luteus]|nr:glycoside hydrolase [Micrococcus luteus]
MPDYYVTDSVLADALAPLDPAALEAATQSAAAAAARAEAAADDLDGLRDAVDSTVTQSPADSAVAAVVGRSGTLARAAVGDVVGLWSPSRAVARGERVIAPNGATMTALSDHTTGEAFDASRYISSAPVTYALNPVSTKADVSRRVVYQESMTVAYAVSQSTAGTLWKTTDSGQTWVQRGDIGFSVHTLTRVMGTGTLIAVELTNRGTPGLNPRVARSTDDGTTWTQVTTLVHPGLGNQGILSPAPSVVLIAEYGNTGNTVFSIRRSADDGVTWAAVLSSPGTDRVSDPGHLHSVVRAPDGTLITFMDRDFP